MEFLREYIRSIAFFLIFSVFAEIILPSEKYKAYIHLVLGLILILIILKPFASENYWSTDILKGLPELTAGADPVELQPYIETRDRMILDLYENRLIDQIAALVESKADYRAVDIEVDIDPGTGVPLQIALVLSPKEAAPTPTPFIRIQEVDLTAVNREKAANISAEQEIERETEQESETKYIKNIVSDFYNLSVDNIHIRVQRKNQG